MPLEKPWARKVDIEDISLLDRLTNSLGQPLYFIIPRRRIYKGHGLEVAVWRHTDATILEVFNLIVLISSFFQWSILD